MKFNKPELNIVRFDAADVIATSGQVAPFVTGGHGHGIMGVYGFTGDNTVLKVDTEALNLDPRLVAMLPETIQLSAPYSASMSFDISFNGTSFQITECTESTHEEGITMGLDTEPGFLAYLMTFVNAGN